MTDTQWYYARGGQAVGPVPFSTLQQMLSEAQVQPSELVWTEGMSDWQPAGLVPALGASDSTAAPLGGATVAGAGGEAVAAPTATMPIGYYTPGTDVRYAGFWIRVVAAIIDALILGVALGTVGAVVGGLVGVLDPGPAAQAVLGVFNLLGNYAVQWLYEALMTSSSKQGTLGKMAVGIKVIGYDGERITFARATGRHFAKYISAIILGVGYIMAGFTERKQGLHDMIASTYAVYKR